MKQRLISLTLSLVMLLQLLPVGVLAAEGEAEGNDTAAALTGQIYTDVDGKEQPLNEKSDPVAIDPEKGYSGIRAKFPQPEETGTFHYLWLYSVGEPASVSLKDMTPVGVNREQWAMEREKYGDPATLFSSKYGDWNPEGASTFPALPLDEIIVETEAKTEELYIACLCVYADSEGSILASGYTSSSARVSYASAAPITGIKTKLVYWPEDPYITAEGQRYEIRTDASSSNIAALVYDSNGKELEYSTKYRWFYGKNATPSLSAMIPVGMTKTQWDTLLDGSAPEEYLKAQYADEEASIWSGVGTWIWLPVLPVGTILGGDTGYLAGAADNGLYFTCCAVWGNGSDTFVGISDGTVQISFYGKAPTLDDWNVRAAPIGFDAPTGSTAELSCELKDYSGTPDYQWYRLNSEEDSTGTAIDAANAAAFTAPYPDTPGEYLYCCAVTYLDDMGRSKTLRSRTAKLTRYPTAMVEIQTYPGLLDLTANTTPEGNYIHYTRQTPSGDIQRADAYQSVGSPISLSARFDVNGLEHFSRLEVAWYVSRETDGFANQELVATHTYDNDLLEKYDEAMKGYDGKDARELNRRRACFDQAVNEHLDLPAEYAATAGLIRVTAVASTYSTVDGTEYCFTDRKTLSVRTLEKNEDLFEVDENGVVTKYIGCETTITFPETKNGQSVTGIGNLSGLEEYGGAYRGFARKLVIPEGYTAIADFAFERLASIEQVTLPSTLKSIGRYAFCETNLQNELTLPDRLESIGARAFYAAPITSLTFGADMFPTIGSRAFANCEKLTVVTFPANAQGSFSASFTGDAAFSGCLTLRSIQNQTAITDLDSSTEAGRNAINKQFGGTPLAAQLLAGQEDDSHFGYEKVSGGWAVARVLEIPSDGVVSFPASYRGEPVTAIGAGSSLFDAAAGVDPLAVTKIVLPDTVTAIGANAFSGCEGLTAVTFPAALTDIGDSAFSGCKGLRGTLSFPTGTQIGQRAFQGCWRVTAIQVEGCSIGHEAFLRCISLKTVSGSWTPDFGVDYPASGKSVSVEFQPFPFTQAVEKFYEKQSYTLSTDSAGTHSYAPGSGSGTVYYQENGYLAFSTTIPYSATKKGVEVHCLDPDATALSFPAKVGTLNIGTAILSDAYQEGVESYTVTVADGITALYGSLPRASAVTLPNTLTQLYSVFSGNRKLTEIALPASLQSIGDRAFYECSWLDTVTFLTDASGKSSLKTIGQKAFEATRVQDITLPEGLTSIGKQAFYRSTVKTVTLPTSLETIGDEAFSTTPELESVTLPAGLKTLGVSAFEYAKKLASVDMSACTNLTAIPRSAFSHCTALRSIVMSDSVTEIGSGAFSSLTDAEHSGAPEITWSRSLKTIGDDAFKGAFRSETPMVLALPDTVEHIGNRAFQKCSIDLAEGRLPAALQTLGISAFEETGLTALVIPETLKVLSANAFSMCLRLQKVTLHHGITEIGNYAFERDANAQFGYADAPAEQGKLVLPNDLEVIGSRAFAYIPITEAVVGEKVRKMDGFCDVLSGEEKPRFTLRLNSPFDTLPESLYFPFGSYAHTDIWCYKDSAAHNWAKGQKENAAYADLITIHLYDAGSLTLTLELKDESGAQLTGSSLYSSLVWENLTTGERWPDKGWSLPNVSREDRYQGVIVFSDAAYLEYDVPHRLIFEFDPSAEGFSRVFTYRLKERTEITVTGSFGDQWALPGFHAEITVQEPGGEQTYSLTNKGDGSFEVTILRFPAVLTAGAQYRENLTLQDLQLRRLDESGKVSLGALNLPLGKLRTVYSHNVPELQQVGTLTLSSQDGSKVCGAIATANSLRLYGEAINLFTAGETVVLKARDNGSNAYRMSPFTFQLQGERDTRPIDSPTFTKRGSVFVVQKDTAAILYDAAGSYVTAISGWGSAYLEAGGYTAMIVARENHGWCIPTAEEFRRSVPDGKYKECTVTVTNGETRLDENAPAYSVTLTDSVTVTAELGKGQAEKDGRVPLYIKFNVPKGVPAEGNRFRIVERSWNEHHFSSVNGSYAFIDQPEGLENVLVTPGGGHANSELTFRTAAAKGAVTVYVQSAGQTLDIYYGEEFVRSVTVPKSQFSLTAPSKVTSNSSGVLTLIASHHGTCRANLYVDGELNNTVRELVSYGQGVNKLNYTLPANSDGIHVLRVDVTDETGELLWQSEEYRVRYTEQEIPQPQTMQVRLLNYNAGADGVSVDQTVTYDFVNGVFPRLKTVIPYWNYNDYNGTMAKELTYFFSLTMSRPEALPKVLTLTVYCNESAPVLRTVPLMWNEETGTFDGSLRFAANSATANDLPYGLDVNYDTALSEVPATSDPEGAITARMEETRPSREGMTEAASLYAAVDTEAMRLLLESCSEFTSEEQQQLLDYAVGWNELCGLYQDSEDALSAVLESISGGSGGVTDPSDLVNLLGGMGVGISQPDLTGVTAENLRAEGFRPVTQEGHTVYLHEQSGTVIDLTNGVVIGGSSSVSVMSANSYADSGWQDAVDQVEDAYNNLQNILTLYDTAISEVEYALDKMTAKLSDQMHLQDEMQAVLDKYYREMQIYEASGGKVKLADGTELVIEKSAVLKPNNFTSEAQELLEKAAQEVKRLHRSIPVLNSVERFNAASCQKFKSAFGSLLGVMGKTAAQNASKLLPVAGLVVGLTFSVYDGVSVYCDLVDRMAQMESIRATADRSEALLRQAVNSDCLKDGSENAYEELLQLREYIYQKTAEVLQNRSACAGIRLLVITGQAVDSIASTFPGMNVAALIFDMAFTASGQLTENIAVGREIDAYADFSRLLDELSRCCYESIDLECWDNCDDCGGGASPTPAPAGSKNPSIQPMGTPVIDPAGYIYEAVASNRLSGVTAKVYYRDDSGNEAYWDEAEIYGETNPQVTDETGTYAWYTPIGNWLVKATKDGYYDADSRGDPAAVDGWLPVPPPQMNVNIGMISKAAPAVKSAVAAANGITLTFSQYMSIVSLTESGVVTVSQNGSVVPVTIHFDDREVSPTDPSVYYGRVMRLVRADGQSFSGGSIVVRVSNGAHNYAGTALPQAYVSPTLRVSGGPEHSIEHSYPNRYVTAPEVRSTLTVRIYDLNGNPAPGVTVTLSARNGNILTIQTPAAITDAEGRARFEIVADNEGDDVLTFRTADGAEVGMNVRVSADAGKPAKPTANLSDYDTVSAGTQLVITAQEGAVIRYTTDDTCPCTDAALTYTGPITLTESGFYRIAAWTQAGSYSERLNLHITVTASGGSSSSGGGGGSVSTYSVTVGKTENGSVSVSPKSASKGDTVTVTVTPDKGYTLDDLTVLDKSGKEIKFTEKNGKYTFTMPASNVEVEATFKAVKSGNPFVDVPSGAYYEDAVIWAVGKGVTSGTDATHFAPNGICTRAQAVTFLWRAAGSPAPKSAAMPFADVSKGSYYEQAVLWAVENGITKGTGDTTFSPNATCSRAQIVTFLWRSQKSPAVGSVNPFTDVSADAYYADAVLWAVKESVTSGTTATTFSPNADCTRAQIVTFIYRALAE